MKKALILNEDFAGMKKGTIYTIVNEEAAKSISGAILNKMSLVDIPSELEDFAKSGLMTVFTEVEIADKWIRDGEDDLPLQPLASYYTDGTDIFYDSADVPLVDGERDPSFQLMTNVEDPRWTYVEGEKAGWRIESDESEIIKSLVSEANSKMDEDIEAMAAQTFGNKKPLTWAIYPQSWKTRYDMPELYVNKGLKVIFPIDDFSYGDVLDTEQKIKDYHLALLTNLVDLDVARDNRIHDYIAEKGSLES